MPLGTGQIGCVSAGHGTDSPSQGEKQDLQIFCADELGVSYFRFLLHLFFRLCALELIPAVKSVYHLRRGHSCRAMRHAAIYRCQLRLWLVKIYFA